MKTKLDESTHDYVKLYRNFEETSGKWCEIFWCKKCGTVVNYLGDLPQLYWIPGKDAKPNSSECVS